MAVHRVELACHALVVGAALAFVTWRGYLFSWQFEQGQRWDRYAPGLQPGYLFGRRVVSCFVACQPCNRLFARCRYWHGSSGHGCYFLNVA